MEKSYMKNKYDCRRYRSFISMPENIRIKFI